VILVSQAQEIIMASHRWQLIYKNLLGMLVALLKINIRYATGIPIIITIRPTSGLALFAT
jgi:hypothetical protein